MNTPSVVHPKRFNVDGYIFEVVAYCKLSDKQAMNVVVHHCRTHKLKKNDKGKLCQIYTLLDEDSANLFGA
jgi:hypothetical protein